MTQKLPSGSWRVRWIVRGERKSKVFPNKEMAMQFKAKVRLGQVIEEEGLAINARNLTFSEFAEKWLRDYCEVEKSETQWAVDASIIKYHLNPVIGKLKIIELRKNDLLELKRGLMNKKKPGLKDSLLKPKTVNNILALAKKMMATAVDWDLMGNNPFAEVKPVKKGNQTFDYWTLEERDKFLDSYKDKDPDFHNVVLVACHTGLRLGELAGLSWESVDFRRKMITVKETYNFKLKKELDRTKNLDSVDIPMNHSVYETLKDMKAAARGKKVFSLELLQTACMKLRRRCKWAGIKPIRFHDLRHTFASCLAMAGVDLMLIKELMRHKSYQMTLRYAHLHPDYLKGATDVLCRKVVSICGHDEKSAPTEWPRNGHETKKPTTFKVVGFSKSLIRQGNSSGVTRIVLEHYEGQ